MTLRSYAKRISVNEDTVKTWKYAADVAVLAGQHFEKLAGQVKHLAAIHAAPETTWPEMTGRILSPVFHYAQAACGGHARLFFDPFVR